MRILGIDLGAKSVKAVELESSFGRFEIHDYYEQPIGIGSDGQPDPESAVRRLIESLPRKPDKIAVAAKPGTVTFRNLRIPTRGKKAIQAAVGFELEDELPFPMERSFHDYSMLGQSKQGSVVHVAVSLKSAVASWIAFWNRCGIDPDLLTTEAWAYRTLLNKVVPQQEAGVSPVLLAQIGQSRTTAYIHWQGAPALAREMDWGGRDLTLAIAKKYGIPYDEAEKAKIDGFVLPTAQKQNVTPEQTEFSDTLIEPLRILIRDLHQAVLTCKNVTKDPPETIFLAGGTSLLPGLSAHIQESLGIAVRPLHGMSATSVSGVTYSEATEASFALPMGLALCMVGQERTSAINFRKGEFSKEARAQGFRLQNFRWVLTSAGAVLASLFLSLAIQSQVYKSKLADADRQLKRNIQSFFGQISDSAVRTYIASTSTLRSAVSTELEQQRQLNSLVSRDPGSPLEILKDFSSAIPKDVVVDVTEVQVGASPSEPYSPSSERTVRLTLLVSNPQMAEKITSLLSGRISGLEKGKVEEVPGQDGLKKWQISFSGKLPDGETDARSSANAEAKGGK
ncbi:MAG: hypothetical protein A2X94_12860 [Bdellovibrionales bacterium GWB1_55_8]|nr:MAG: hypothetical protein A2X94_12860 [Bdellovibrionales bacterium GWB1_55_8]